MQHHEDEAGFFITGINTAGQDHNQSVEVENQEDQDMDLMQLSQDEADNWKHVAIVDFTNAFSTQEVS